MKIAGNIITLSRAETLLSEDGHEAGDKFSQHLRERALALAAKLGRPVVAYASKAEGGWVVDQYENWQSVRRDRCP